MGQDVYIGIDGGGTYTRVVCARIDGTVLGYAEGGGANPDYNADAEANLRRTVADALTDAARTPDDIAGVVAGLAGLDYPDDQEWADRYAALPGTACPSLAVNDTEVALAGALALQPGILSIASTGTNTFGRTESRRLVGNYTHFRHYAHMAARHLTYAAVYGIIAGDAADGDETLVADVLEYWGATDIAELRETALGIAAFSGMEHNRRGSGMGPVVTRAAEAGSPLAQAVCNAAVEETIQAIRLVASCFAGDAIPVVLHGAVANAAYIHKRLLRRLAEVGPKRLVPAKSLLPPAYGAALMAADRWGETPIDSVAVRLQETRR